MRPDIKPARVHVSTAAMLTCFTTVLGNREHKRVQLPDEGVTQLSHLQPPACLGEGLIALHGVFNNDWLQVMTHIHNE